VSAAGATRGCRRVASYRAARVLFVLLSAATVEATSALAQTSRPTAPPRAPRPARYELSGGVSWVGGYGLGTSDATLTGNTGGDVVLFRTDAEMSGAVGFDVRVGVRLTRRLVADAAFGYARPELRVQVSEDFEQAPDVALADAVSQYVIGGDLRYHFSDWTSQSRSVLPFALGGVAYLRQLASDAASVEDGIVVSGGAGLLWRLGGSARGTLRGYGLRADGRVNWRTSGIDLEDKGRAYVSAGLGGYVRF